ncbi:hypothetical protein BO94DRAFT_10777 [Aspergillus sclerotioniger CBS 115572]|uniref:MARVEL domain-containing protein n=1 Tax=Aspergillus sclerotioniger CBS 115572 TaxID=1450535 RepID=A0A317XFA6_9EURO|nr:hypothetical protein BO94DRAFT_10777 [Aspergillus sclerotioniger CBS 115572]PWY96447.1 hypothetical protein BO94DRAFT_10777 [Aspergillus sclerotioniger CBS 115572]
MSIFLALRLLKRIFLKSKSQDTNNNPETINLSYPPPPNQPPQRPRLKHYTELTLHFTQLIFGLTTLILYGKDVHASHKDNKHADPRWVYAIVTGMMGCGTALFYLVLMHWVLKKRTPLAARMRWNLPLFVWEAVLCVFWLTLFGIFGEMYIGDYEDSSKVTRMRHAVWVDLVNLGLWVGSALWKGVRWWRGQRAVVGVDAVEKGEGEGV